MDYFFFLEKTINYSGFQIIPIYLISERNYRSAGKRKGLKKLYLRIQMYLFYPIVLMIRAIISPRNSIFIVTSNTFYAPLLTKIAAFWKGTKVVHLLYDLYPDAIEVAGVIKYNGLTAKLIGKLTRRNLKLSDATIYLGDFLKLHTESRWAIPTKSHVIPISTDISLYENHISPMAETNKIIIHYGGQLGHLHDADSIIGCIKYILESEIKDRVEFNFYVSGAQASFLKKSLHGFPVKIKAAVSSEVWRNDIKNFHVGLVTLTPGGATVCLPSKTYGMMAGGLSILAICPIWSDLANLVLENNAGWVINNSTKLVIGKEDMISDNYLTDIVQIKSINQIKENFYNILKSILSDNSDLKIKRENAFYCVRQKFNAEILSKQWLNVINEL